MRPVCLEGSDGFVTSTAAPIATGPRAPRVAGWELHPLETNTFPRPTHRIRPCEADLTLRSLPANPRSIQRQVD